MKLQDLQTGMRLILRDYPGFWIVFRNLTLSEFAYGSDFVAIRRDESGWIDLNAYNDNMMYPHTSLDEFDIMQVMTANVYSDIFGNAPTEIGEPSPSWQTYWIRDGIDEQAKLIREQSELIQYQIELLKEAHEEEQKLREELSVVRELNRKLILNVDNR